jgi:pilus assembly protein CpaF
MSPVTTEEERLQGMEGYLQALGPLRVLVEYDSLTEIMVVGPDMVYVEAQGRIVLTDVRFRDS